MLRCKRQKWELRERQRLRQREELLSELLDKFEEDRKRELAEIEREEQDGLMGRVGADEQRKEVADMYDGKTSELRNVYALADPANFEKREVPEYLVDNISFEIMHDRMFSHLFPSLMASPLPDRRTPLPISPSPRDRRIKLNKRNRTD